MIVRTYKFADYADFSQHKGALSGVSRCLELGIKWEEQEVDGETEAVALSGYHVDVIWESSADSSVDYAMIWVSTPDVSHDASLWAEYESTRESI